MIKNLYRVPKRQWQAWSFEAKKVFNSCHLYFYKNQTLLIHPKAPQVSASMWQTTAWNAAWIAADAVDDCVPEYIIEGDKVHECR